MPPIKQGFEYTLVVDLDETLIHFNDDGYYLIRPGVPVFLQELSKYYEIVIFTAACKLLCLIFSERLCRHDIRSN